MPAIDRLAEEYEGRVTVVAPAWKSSLENTARVVDRLLPSGRVLWGMDYTQEIFGAYGVGYQPAGAIVSARGELVTTWPGSANIETVRGVLDALLEEA